MNYNIFLLSVIILRLSIILILKNYFISNYLIIYLLSDLKKTDNK